jgi:hypothetical protein
VKFIDNLKGVRIGAKRPTAYVPYWQFKIPFFMVRAEVQFETRSLGRVMATGTKGQRRPMELSDIAGT